MFSEYNYNFDPIIIVNFNKSLNNDNEFDDFLYKWLELYKRGKDYIFLFDTRKMNDVPFKYCIKMALFIKKLKKEKYHYLKKSIILVNNEMIKNMLDIVFMIQRPVAPVYIWNTSSIIDKNILRECILCKKTRMNKNMIYVDIN